MGVVSTCQRRKKRLLSTVAWDCSCILGRLENTDSALCKQWLSQMSLAWGLGSWSVPVSPWRRSISSYERRVWTGSPGWGLSRGNSKTFNKEGEECGVEGGRERKVSQRNSVPGKCKDYNDKKKKKKNSYRIFSWVNINENIWIEYLQIVCQCIFKDHCLCQECWNDGWASENLWL